MHLFTRRLAITLVGGCLGGIALTILLHLLIGFVTPNWQRDGQYVLIFLLLIPGSVLAGILASLYFAPLQSEHFGQTSGVVVGGVLSLVLSALILWSIVLFGVHVLGW
jgi:hypothetical protein